MTPPNIDKQRARSPDDKAARRERLLDAALRLLEHHPYDGITVATVAREGGLAKASAYTYFATKEALFLALLARELTRWATALDRRLGRRARSARSLARVISESLVAAPTLRELLGRLHSTLEANVPAEQVLAFKRYLAQLLDAGGATLERVMPGLEGKGERVLLTTYALVIGFGQLAEPAPAIGAALDRDPALAARFRVDFVTTLADTLETLLSAWSSPDTPRA